MSRTPITSFSANKLSQKVKKRTPKKRTYKTEKSRVISVKRAIKLMPMGVNRCSVNNSVTANVKKHISAVRLRKNELRARIEQIILESCPTFLSPLLPHNASLLAIRRKADEIAASLGVEKFNSSRKWVLSFVQRHKLLNTPAVVNNKCVNNGSCDGVNNTSDSLVKVRFTSTNQSSDSDTSLEEVDDAVSLKNPPSLKALFANPPARKEFKNKSDNDPIFPLNEATSFQSVQEKSSSDESLTPIWNLFCTPPRSSSEDCPINSSHQVQNNPKNGLSVSSVKDVSNSILLSPLSNLFAKPLSPLLTASKSTKRKSVIKKFKKKVEPVIPQKSTAKKDESSCPNPKESSPFPGQDLMSFPCIPPTQSHSIEKEDLIDIHLKEVKNWQQKLYLKHKPKNLKRTFYTEELYRRNNLIPLQKLSACSTGYCLVFGDGESVPDVLKCGRSSQQKCNDLFDALNDIESESTYQEVLMETQPPQDEYFCTPDYYSQTTMNETETFIDELTSNFTIENVDMDTLINDFDFESLDFF